MKELGLEMIKVHGSRMVGSLMTPSHTFAVFNGMDAVPTFDTQIEQRGKIMLQNIRYMRTGASHTPDGILLSDQWAVMTTLLKDAKTYKKEHFLFGEGYEHFYFLTNDYHGETLLWLLCHPDVIGQLNATLLQELQPPCRNAFIICCKVSCTSSVRTRCSGMGMGALSRSSVSFTKSSDGKNRCPDLLRASSSV